MDLLNYFILSMNWFYFSTPYRPNWLNWSLSSDFSLIICTSSLMSTLMQSFSPSSCLRSAIILFLKPFLMSYKFDVISVSLESMNFLIPFLQFLVVYKISGLMSLTFKTFFSGDSLISTYCSWILEIWSNCSVKVSYLEFKLLNILI